MKQFSKIMFLTMGLGLFAFVLSSLPNHPAAAAGSAPVTVTNAAANPVPVTGSVNAAVTGNVNATIVGTPSVNISFPSSIGVTGGPVNVANTPTTPIFNRDVDNPASQPFVGFLCAGTAGECGRASASFAVPTTVGGRTVQRFVIEYYSAECEGVTGSTAPINDLLVFSGGQQNNYFIGPLLPASGFFYSNQQTRIYADPGVSVGLESANLVGGACQVTVTGYLVLQ